MRSRIALVLVVLVALLAGPVVPAGAADLSRLVVVGDSLSAGYQNGGLLDAQQAHGYASLVAAQAGVALPLPLIATPGIPNVLALVSPGPPPVVVPAPGVSTGRTDPFVQPMNLAVPGATVQDALSTRPDWPVDTMTDLVLGLPGLLAGPARSQVEWAEALAPTAILVWLGSNDALGAAVAADTAWLTPVAAFEAAYAETLARLAATGAALVVANIPDVTVIPYLTPAEGVADAVGLPLALVGPILGIGPGDFVTPDAFPLVGPILGGGAPGPLPGSVVLDAGEVAAIREAVAGFNAVIAAQATARGAALVDVHGILEAARERGIVAGGQRLTTAYLGGLFSLDGIHPTNTAYAVIANAFIRALNRTHGTDVAPVVLRDVQRDDPLVLPGVGHPATALEHVDAATAASLRGVLAR